MPKAVEGRADRMTAAPGDCDGMGGARGPEESRLRDGPDDATGRAAYRRRALDGAPFDDEGEIYLEDGDLRTHRAEGARCRDAVCRARFGGDARSGSPGL